MLAKTITRISARLERGRRRLQRMRGDAVSFDFRGKTYLLNPERANESQISQSVPKLARMTDLIDSSVSTIFDIGGNCGLFSAFAARAAPRANIYCFEPSASLIPIIQQNTANLPITIINKAVSDTNGDATLFVNKTSQQTNSLNRAAVDIFARDRPIHEVRVGCVTLDAFARSHQIDRVDVLKVDVQGFEGAVFRGASSILPQAQMLFIESTWMDITSISGILPFAHRYGFRYLAVVNSVAYGADVLLSRAPVKRDSVVIAFDLNTDVADGAWLAPTLRASQAEVQQAVSINPSE